MSTVDAAKPPALLVGGRLFVFALAVSVTVWLAVYLHAALSGWLGSHIGWDFTHYVEGAERWLATGSPYEAWSLAGPYAFDDMAFVHPPIALPLFAAFTVLPTVLWWVVPLGVTGWFVASQRPSLTGWVGILLILALPLTLEKVLVGNSVMWVAAFAVLGLRFGYPWALVAIKPTLAFLGLVGIRDRRTWIGGVVLLVACLPFGALWFDWISVVRNFAGSSWYTVLDVPFALIPVVAYYSRATSRGRAPGPRGLAPSAP